MKEANINRVMRSMYEKNSEKGNALNIIRNSIFKIFNGVSAGRITKEEAITAAWSFAKNAMDNGTVTQEDIEKIIAIAAKNIDNVHVNKTGMSR